MQVTWEKEGNVALQEEVRRACLEQQVSQVSVLYDSTGLRNW